MIPRKKAKAIAEGYEKARAHQENASSSRHPHSVLLPSQRIKADQPLAQYSLKISFKNAPDCERRLKLIYLPAMKALNLVFLLMFGPFYLSAIAQQSSHGKQDDFAGVNARGDQGMGFSHEKTTHHFYLLIDGGAIEIQSNEATDAASQEAIRQHLAMIAVKFSGGDFAIPMFIHATVPPGVETMKRLKSKITYTAENTARGAQVRVATHDAEALTAIHRFLRFQIQDHQTGDSLGVQK